MPFEGKRRSFDLLVKTGGKKQLVAHLKGPGPLDSESEQGRLVRVMPFRIVMNSIGKIRTRLAQNKCG